MTDADPPTQQWLEDFIRREGAVAGTVHRRRGEVLVLVAAHNIPPPVAQITAVIPKGKGMAGLAWERAQPVQTCNLQADKSGDVRPGARAVNAKAAIALPVLDAAGEVVAVVGVAFPEEGEVPAEKVRHLVETAAPTLPAGTSATE